MVVITACQDRRLSLSSNQKRTYAMELDRSLPGPNHRIALRRHRNANNVHSMVGEALSGDRPVDHILLCYARRRSAWRPSWQWRYLAAFEGKNLIYMDIEKK